MLLLSYMNTSGSRVYKGKEQETRKKEKKKSCRSMKTISFQSSYNWDGVSCCTYASSLSTTSYKVIKMGGSKKQSRPPSPKVSFLFLLFLFH
jgi:hypothetical protein